MIRESESAPSHRCIAKIPDDAVRRWLQIATQAFDSSPVFKLHVLDLIADPTVFGLMRAAEAARNVASSVKPPLSLLAAQAAAEMEEMARG